jgi:hypothetical protein
MPALETTRVESHDMLDEHGTPVLSRIYAGEPVQLSLQTISSHRSSHYCVPLLAPDGQ